MWAMLYLFLEFLLAYVGHAVLSFVVTWWIKFDKLKLLISTSQTPTAPVTASGHVVFLCLVVIFERVVPDFVE